MSANKKKLIVVGDRVLVTPEEGEERTSTGLLLPKSAIDTMAVQSGRVVGLGPGTPVGAEGGDEDEPWKQKPREARYFPMQAREGDVALFFRRAAVEVSFEGKTYLVVPHQAILLLVREERSVTMSSDEAPIDPDF